MRGAFVRGVRQLDIPLEVVHTAPGDVTHWEHEVFVRTGLRAATLSARRTPPPSLARSSVLDCGSAAVNATSVSRTVRLVRAAAFVCRGSAVQCSAVSGALVSYVSPPHVLHTRYTACLPVASHRSPHVSAPHVLAPQLPLCLALVSHKCGGAGV